MIESIVILLTLLLFLAIKLLDGHLSRPSLLYIGGFWICSLVAFLFKKEWGLANMSSGTFFYIVCGAALFLYTEYIFNKKCPIHYKIVNDNDFRPIKSWKLICFFLFQLFAFALMARAKMAYAGGLNLSEALLLINNEQKFENTLVHFPFYINTPYNICLDGGWIWTILLPYYQHKPKKYKTSKYLVLLNFLTLLMGCLISGGRMIMFFYIGSYFCFYYISYKYKRKWPKMILPRSMIIKSVLMLLVIAMSFQFLGSLVGRDTRDTTASIILPMYCGAQIKNLDDYLKKTYKHGNESDLPGQYTFQGFYNKIAERMGSMESRTYSVSLPFNSYGKYPLGNVYTTYYYYHSDFKYYGILMCILMALIYAFLYKKALESDFWSTGHLNYWVIFYSCMCLKAFLSFFANQFLANLTVTSLVRTFLYWTILTWFFQGRKLKYRYRRI